MHAYVSKTIYCIYYREFHESNKILNKVISNVLDKGCFYLRTKKQKKYKTNNVGDTRPEHVLSESTIYLVFVAKLVWFLFRINRPLVSRRLVELHGS